MNNHNVDPGGIKVATFELKDYIDIGTIGLPTAVSWEISDDELFTNIIDKVTITSGDMFRWVTPLPRKNGGYYSDITKLHVRVKVTIHNDISDWGYGEPKDQNDQNYVVTENGVIIDTLNSIIDNIN